MPPKKKDAGPVIGPWMLGRFSNNLKVGLVGAPNVGKSTLYNSLSKSHHSEAANYPFCTINPSETRVFVEDDRFDWLVDYAKPKSVVKPFLTIVDIAGLIKGASQGAGLGNAFLSHINAVDGIIHVMRAFEDDAVIHHDDKPNPVADIEMITSELRIKDLATLRDMYERHSKLKQGAATKSPAALKAWETERDAMQKFIAYLESGKDIRLGLDQWTTKDIEFLNDYMLLTAKPVMFAVNLNFTDFKRKKNKFLKPIFDWVQENAPGSMIIPYCGSYEEEIQDLDAAAVKLREESEDGAPSALPKMIRNAFTMVNLIYYFTYGPQEVRAWVIRRSTKAPQAGAVIHTDFEKAFIMAEVMAFDELKEAGSEAAMKERGRWRQEGKNYEVQDGDVITFKIGQLTAAKK
jgi:obg-like ATPase 1